MRIYTLIAALALCLVAVCLWAQSEDETIKIGRLPYYLSEFAKAGGTEFLISKKSLADARVIRVRYAQRSWAEEKIAAICRPDEIADAVEKHMDSRITEYPLVETERLNKDLDLEIYETEKGLKSEWDKADAYLLVLRHDGRVVWFSQKRAFRSKPYGERQKNEIDRPDAMVLPDGRYLVVTSQSACYTKEAGGKLVIGPVFGGRINWIEETENKHRGMYKMPSGYPTVKILTDNVVRHSYPDGCEEHWALRLSGEDTEKNKSRFSAPAEKDDYVGNLIQNTYANLLWWNGKYGETTKECAEENSKRFRVWYFKKSVKEPVYDGGAYIKTEAPLSEIIPKEHLEKMQRGAPGPFYGVKPIDRSDFVKLYCKEGEDITRTLRDALKDHRHLILAKGIYRISGTIELRGGTVVSAEPGTILRVEGFDKRSIASGASVPGAPAGSVFRVTGKIQDKGYPVLKTEFVTVGGFTFVSETRQDVAAVAAYSVTFLSVQNVQTYGMGLAYVSVAHRLPGSGMSAEKDVKTDLDLNDRINIRNCDADLRAGESGSLPGIWIEYSRDIAIENCRVKNCGQGIVLAGSRPGGFVTLKNAVMTGCAVQKASERGISVSDCADITLTGCRVSECKNTGIAFKDCQNTKAENCFAGDCGTNYYTESESSCDAVFTGCRSEYSEALKDIGGQHYCNVSFAAAGRGEVVIENCVFESRIRSRVRESGTLKRFVFKNNRCVNTSFESDDPADTGGGENSIVLESNVFENDRQNSVCAVTLRLCGHSASVCNNVIKGDGGAAGILVSELSSGGTGRAFIDNNKIEGFRETVTVSAVKDITVSGSDIKGEIK